MRSAALRAHRSVGVASQPKGLAGGVDDPAAERGQQQGGHAEQDKCVACAPFHAPASMVAIAACGSRLPSVAVYADRLPIAMASSEPTATIAAPA